MTAPAAFQASYADVKVIKSRRIMQVILEVSLEQADAALAALGGLPRPDQETWVGVARIKPKTAVDAPKAQEKPKAKWSDLPYSQQAAIRCNEPGFQKFYQGRKLSPDWGVPTAGEVADLVRDYCGVVSRSDIRKGTPEGDRWETLEREYQEWCDGLKYADAVR